MTIVKRHKLQWYGQNHLARHSERGKKTRQTDDEVGRHQGMDRPGVRQVPEGGGEQREMEETGCDIRILFSTCNNYKEHFLVFVHS